MLTITSSKASYDYSSTQFNFPQKLAKCLKKWGYANIPASDVYKEDDGSKGRGTDSHITVKYGLTTNNPEDVRKVVQGFGSFDVILGKVSRFARPDKDYDVVKIDIESDRLQELHKLLGDELDNKDEYDEYRPHATLSYINKGTCVKLSGDDEFLGEKVEVSNIVFSPKIGNLVIIKL